MLPGYNHNIRYREKVFHVQTEDNGLNDPDLVTQVFLGGQIVAIERSSYTEVLFENLEEKVRSEKIKALMQDQHKRLLKALVHGEYDAKIETFLQAAARAAEAPAQVAETRQPAPRQPSTPAMSFEALDAAILAAEQNPITPESLLAPDAVLELSTNVLFPQDPRQSDVSIPRSPTPSQFLIEDLDDLKAAPDRSDSDSAMLGMIEQHVHQQMPWTPAETPDPSSRETLEESSPKALSHIQRARELAKNQDSGATKRISVSNVGGPSQDDIEINELPTKIGRRRPSNSRHEVRVEPATVSQPPTISPSPPARGKQPDTLIDYGLPASLRREIDEEIARRLQAKSTSSPGVKPGSNPGIKVGSNPGVKVGSNPGVKVGSNPGVKAGSNPDRQPVPLARPPVYRQPAQKPEGRYSSVRKVPGDRPFEGAPTPVDLNLEKAQAKVIPEPARGAAGARRTTRPAAPDPKTSAPAAPAAPVAKKTGPSERHAQAEDTKRPSILVVERSLDEVILSYLYDEMAEK
jgi:hypothetical protein